MDPTVQQVIEFFKANGVAVAILVFAAWFLTFRFWPWYTKDYFPTQIAERQRQEAEQVSLRNAITALGTNLQSLPVTLGAAMLAGVTPQLELIVNQMRSDLNSAREQSVNATGSRIDPLVNGVAHIKTLLDSEVTASRTRHDELLAKMDSATNHLTMLFLGIKGVPQPAGADSKRLDVARPEPLT